MTRSAAAMLCVALAACTSGPQTVPRNEIFYEVPPQAAQPQGPDDFTGRIEAALAEGPPGAPAAAIAPATAIAPGSAVPPGGLATVADVTVPPGVAPTPLDDDQLNLGLYTLEQQRIDAAIAERELAAARSQLVIVQPGSVPQQVQGVNIALYAQQTSNAVGQRVYARGAGFGSGACRRYASADDAQRAFLASGGPARDPNNLDPDGDGFACTWDPEPYRRLVR